MSILKEITPLANDDCFTIFSRSKSAFDFPYHYHDEMEINFILNAKGAKRIIAGVEEEIDDIELVLVGSNIPHVWETHKCNSLDIQEVTIQFHKDLLDDKFLRRGQLKFMREMLQKSKYGIAFSRNTALHLKERLLSLHTKQNFDSVIELLSILHDLSISRNTRLLCDDSMSSPAIIYNSRRIEKVMQYLQSNYDKNVQLSDCAKLVNMADVSFSRFFKNKTGMSFIDTLIQIRIGKASRSLIDTHQTVSEIAYNCGFNNISNFNRKFKQLKNITPAEFRANHRKGNRIFI
ncbi:AraC family transcriptional regulator [Gynurincola endophyticus]|jgi:AraC-like DNA-binding protein|uniref:AraC family transcriptional regulator n=1 Tax=Gynurincola endophyticus TaxID=2479004 RepID=UPI000F8EAA4B|nr:AraC family transcriptional regulator [Gynurincola endophyticus]